MLAVTITDFIYDSTADTLASKYGLPISSGFKSWIESTQIISALNHPRRGRIFSDNWNKVWKRMTEARVCESLNLAVPKPIRDFWTIYVSLDMVNLADRASKLGLGAAKDILNNLKRMRLSVKF